MHVLGTQLIRRGDRFKHPNRCGVHERGVLETGDDNGELVSPGTRDRIAFAHHAGDALGHRDQERIPLRMAECVVDALEVVQIHKENREPAVRPPRLRKRVLESVVKQEAVWQSGEGIVSRRVPELVLGLSDLRDVREDADRVSGPLLIVLGHRNGHPRGEDRAVRFRLPGLALPLPRCKERFLQGLIELARMPVGLKEPRALAKRLLPRTPCQPTEGLVDFHYLVVSVRQGHHDALVRHLEHRAGQFQTLGGTPLFGHVVKGDQLCRRSIGVKDKRRYCQFDVAGFAFGTDRQHCASEATAAKKIDRACQIAKDRLGRLLEYVRQAGIQHREGCGIRIGHTRFVVENDNSIRHVLDEYVTGQREHVEESRRGEWPTTTERRSPRTPQVQGRCPT